MPIHWRLSFCAAVPQPQNGSSTTSFSFDEVENNALQERERFLRWVSETLLRIR
jgi:hypothetical protein